MVSLKRRFVRATVIQGYTVHDRGYDVERPSFGAGATNARNAADPQRYDEHACDNTAGCAHRRPPQRGANGNEQVKRAKGCMTRIVPNNLALRKRNDSPFAQIFKTFALQFP